MTNYNCVKQAITQHISDRLITVQCKKLTTVQKATHRSAQAGGFPLLRNTTFNWNAKLSSLSWSKPEWRQRRSFHNTLWWNAKHKHAAEFAPSFEHLQRQIVGLRVRDMMGICHMGDQHRVNNIHNAFAAALRARRYVGGWDSCCSYLPLEPQLSEIN